MLEIADEEYREKIDEMHRFMTEQLLPTKYKSDTAKSEFTLYSVLQFNLNVVPQPYPNLNIGYLFCIETDVTDSRFKIIFINI